MSLKKYQRRVYEEVGAYLERLAAERAGNPKHAALDAWPSSCGKYNERKNGLGEDLPTFCIKVPTGGGKTLLATQILGSIHRTILKDRNGAGLVLWVVPSSQIYRDTLRRLSDRNDMYRQMLEHAVSRRIEIWEKDDIARLSPVRLRDNLNILIVQLASTNRETKEQLKFFRDSGGNIVNHFPPENDWRAHEALKKQFPNLEMLEEDPSSGRFLCKTSVGNLVRICKPAVILDEGHKATSTLARKRIEDFNSSIVVELSATPPPEANIISRVSGDELLKEEMIKLPLNVKTSGKKKWQDILTEARDKRVALAKKAYEFESEVGPRRHIRPIVLVQVQRTGREQVDTKFIHAEKVREYLRQKLDVPEAAIRIKSAENDGLEDVDLLDPGCQVEWIITKSALQEGWDCPFAYILVSLDNTGSGKAMTQLVGRVLRQPYQERTKKYPELNESYAYCLHDKPAEVLKSVKRALENEGYEGEVQSFVREGEGGGERIYRDTVWRDGFKSLYTRPFEGKIYLPRFCVKEGGEYAPLDYFRHLISRVDASAFEYDGINWSLADVVREQKERLYRITLGEEAARQDDVEIDHWERDESVLAWLAANLDFPYLSFKQLRTIVERTFERLNASHLYLRGKLALVKTELRNKLTEFIVRQIDKQTERAFGDLFDARKILFYLHCAECRFEMPDCIRVENTATGRLIPLRNNDGGEIERSLFDFVEDQGFNDYERKVALVLDKDANVLWWYRNKVGRNSFAIQGFLRHQIHPDFVVQQDHEGKTVHRVLVIETKGPQLKGSENTEYKRKVADYFTKAGKKVTWQQLGEGFKDHLFRFQILDEAQPDGRDWKDELCEILASDA